MGLTRLAPTKRWHPVTQPLPGPGDELHSEVLDVGLCLAEAAAASRGGTAEPARQHHITHLAPHHRGGCKQHSGCKEQVLLCHSLCLGGFHTSPSQALGVSKVPEVKPS